MLQFLNVMIFLYFDEFFLCNLHSVIYRGQPIYPSSSEVFVRTCSNLFILFRLSFCTFLFFLSFKEGWYDGGSVLLSVILVLVVAGVCMKPFLSNFSSQLFSFDEMDLLNQVQYDIS